MINKIKSLKIKTKSPIEFIDITNEIESFIKESGVIQGLINIQTLHTTCSLIVNENTPDLLEDFKNNLERISPENLSYSHPENSPSHCKSIHLPVSLTLNIENKNIKLGTWQRILLAELDGPRLREIQMLILGI